MEVETYVTEFEGEEITHQYYKNKIDLDKVDINKIERDKLLYDYGCSVLLGPEIMHSYALENILSKHGYNPKSEFELDRIFDMEFPTIKEEICDVRAKYNDLKEENEILSKYKDANKDYLTQEEKDNIKQIEDEIDLKRGIEEHNLVIEKLQRIEANIDKLGPRAEEQYYSKQKVKNETSVMSLLATLLSIFYVLAAGVFILTTGGIGEFLSHNCFGQYSGILEKGMGVVVIILFIVLLVSMYLGCISLMNKWYEKLGLFAFIGGVLGVLYGPLILFQAFDRNHMEIELGYSDPSKSYGQVNTEYQKMRAAKKINRGW